MAPVPRPRAPFGGEAAVFGGADPNFSREGVRFANGAIHFNEADLVFDGFSRPWGHVRSFDNASTRRHDGVNGVNGVNWHVSQMPRLSSLGGATPSTLALHTSPATAQWFDRVGNTNHYRARFTQKASIVHDATDAQYVLTDSAGRQMLFFDFAASNTAGMLKGLVDAFGTVTQAGYDDLDRLVSLVRSIDGRETGFYYTYLPRSGSPGLLAAVTLKIKGRARRRVVYDYYEAQENGGLPHDLKSASVEECGAQGSSWRKTGTSYYRYYTADDSHGFSHGLKYAVGPEGCRRMADDGLNPETVTDARLGRYADCHLAYDWQRRVVQLRVHGGQRSTTFSYFTNPNPAEGPNAWVTRTTETLSKGGENVVYSNLFGQTLFKIQRDQTGEQFFHYQYDDSGNRVLAAETDAVQSYDETLPSLATLKPKSGLIRLFQHYAERDPSGQPAGFLKAEISQQGTNGAPRLLRELFYTSRTVGYDTIHLPSKEILHQPSSGDLSPRFIQIAYDKWFENSFQFRQRTTTQSGIAKSGHGSAVSKTVVEIFDESGRRTWLKDERGSLVAFITDPATGALIRQIDDVDTRILAAPNGWATPAGGGSHKISKFPSDDAAPEMKVHQTTPRDSKIARASRARIPSPASLGKTSLQRPRKFSERDLASH